MILKHFNPQGALENLRVCVGIQFRIRGTRGELDRRGTRRWTWCDRWGKVLVLEIIGTLRSVTSYRSRGLVPFPGIKTNVAPLRWGELPTASPNSAEGAYFHSRSRGGIALTYGATKRKLEIASNLWCRTHDCLMGRDRKVKPLISVWSTVCCGDPGVHGIIPPGWAQGLLVVK